MQDDPRNLNFYERLGVAQDATDEQIKAAYKGLRKQFHPDGRPDAYRAHFDDFMKGINEARDALLDPRQRAKHDRKIAEERLKKARAGQAPPRQGPPPQGDQDERRRQEEARQRAEREREAQEARDRQRREEEERRAQEEAQGQEDEEWYWSEEGDAPGPAGGHEAPRAEPEPAAPAAGGLVHRLPGPVHRAGLYVSGSWAWFLAVWGVGLVPIPGLGTAAVLVGLAASVLAGILWVKAGAVMSVGERVIRRLVPSLGRFSAVWYGRRVLESVALAPVVFFLGAVFSFVWEFLSLAAMVYVGLWVAEILRRPRGAAGTGG